MLQRHTRVGCDPCWWQLGGLPCRVALRVMHPYRALALERALQPDRVIAPAVPGPRTKRSLTAGPRHTTSFLQTMASMQVKSEVI